MNDESKHDDTKSPSPDPDISNPLSHTPDTLYTYNTQLIDRLRKEQPWEADPLYFKSCKVSTLAAMKMLKHALLGVQRGKADNGIYALQYMICLYICTDSILFVYM
jgi:hypothetical protein